MASPSLDEILNAITTTVQRYASLEDKLPKKEILLHTRPYSELGIKSVHDVGITCEVEAILGIQLPMDQTLLYQDNRALSIEQSARRVVTFLESYNR